MCVDVSCSGFMEAGSMRSLGLLPMANSMGVLPLRVNCVFLTVAALRISWAGVICDRVVSSRFFGGCFHECREKAFQQSNTLWLLIVLSVETARDENIIDTRQEPTKM